MAAWMLPAAIAGSALAQLGGGIMSAGGAAAQNAAAAQRNQNEMSMFMRQNDLNQWYFAKNFENEQYMSNTAYQRAMADMRAAGLNPVLAYQQGGASANAGGMQSAAGGNLSDSMPENPAGEIGRGMSRAVQSGLDAAHTLETVKNINQSTETERQRSRNVELDNALKIEQTFKTAADIDKVKADTNLSKGQFSQLEHVQKLLGAQSAQAYAQAGLAGAQTPGARASSEAQQDYGPGFAGQTLNTMDRTRKTAQEWVARQARNIYESLGGSRRPTPTVPNR